MNLKVLSVLLASSVGVNLFLGGIFVAKMTSHRDHGGECPHLVQRRCQHAHRGVDWAPLLLRARRHDLRWLERDSTQRHREDDPSAAEQLIAHRGTIRNGF